MCHISVRDDATYFGIRKSRLRVWCKHSQVVSQFLSSEWTHVFVSSCSALCCCGFPLIISDYIGTLVWGIKGFVFMIIKHLCALKNAENRFVATALSTGHQKKKKVHSVLCTVIVKLTTASKILILFLWLAVTSSALSHHNQFFRERWPQRL